MRLIAFFFLFLFLFTSPSSEAAMVRYIDEAGKVHYVNTDRVKVPRRYQNQIKEQLKANEEYIPQDIIISEPNVAPWDMVPGEMVPRRKNENPEKPPEVKSVQDLKKHGIKAEVFLRRDCKECEELQQQEETPPKDAKEDTPKGPSSAPEEPAPPPDADSPPPLGDLKISSEKASKQVFIIQDEDSKITKECINFIETLKLKPVIIKSRVYRTKSIDQILKKYSHIPFAIVILSADDFVYPKTKKPAIAKLRAKQEMVFALGCFLGKLGKQNVFVFYREQKSFLLPTPLHEAIYTPHDPKGHWRRELMKRLETCGYPIQSS